MERQEAYELSPAGIAEQNRYLLQRQQEFRLAADAVTAAWSERGEVEAVALFGSVAVALWKEVPRFRTYRRAGIALRVTSRKDSMFDNNGPVAIDALVSELGRLRRRRPGPWPRRLFSPSLRHRRGVQASGGSSSCWHRLGTDS